MALTAPKKIAQRYQVVYFKCILDKDNFVVHSKDIMFANQNSFKRIYIKASNIFAVVLIFALISIPAFFCVIGITIALMWLGLKLEEKPKMLVMSILFGVFHFAMFTVWLFKKYGATSAFINFCKRNPRFRITTLLIINSATVAYSLVVAFVKSAKNLIESIFDFITRSIGIILTVLILGGIFYAAFSAFSAPWWAIVIIYLFINNK